MRRSNVERLPAAAAVLLVRGVELEPLVQALLHEVELRAVEVGEALPPGRPDAQAQAHAPAAFLDVALHVVGSARSEGHGHLSPPPSSRARRTSSCSRRWP